MTTPLVILRLARLPPSVNHYYLNREVTTKRGRYMARMISPGGLAFRDDVLEAALKARGRRGPLNLSGRLALDVVVTPKNKVIFDLDNLLKPLQDALTKAMVIRDDSLFDRVSIERYPVAEAASTVITIYQIHARTP